MNCELYREVGMGSQTSTSLRIFNCKMVSALMYISLHPTTDTLLQTIPFISVPRPTRGYVFRTILQTHSYSDTTRAVHKGKCRKKSWTTRNEPTTAVDSHSGRKWRRRRTEWNILDNLGRISRTKQEAVVRWMVSGDGARGDGLC